MIFCPLDPNPWIRTFLRKRIQEAKILRIQRIRILSTAWKDSIFKDLTTSNLSLLEFLHEDTVNTKNRRKHLASSIILIQLIPTQYSNIIIQLIPTQYSNILFQPILTQYLNILIHLSLFNTQTFSSTYPYSILKHSYPTHPYSIHKHSHPTHPYSILKTFSSTYPYSFLTYFFVWFIFLIRDIFFMTIRRAGTKAGFKSINH